MNKKTLKALYGAHNPQIPPIENMLLSQVFDKARQFNSPLFSNITFLQSLLTLQFDDEIPFGFCNALREVIEWIAEAERSAQLSEI